MSADIPDFHTLDVDQIQVLARAGDKQDIKFRVMPKKRAVRLIGPGTPEVLRSAPATPKPQTGRQKEGARPEPHD